MNDLYQILDLDKFDGVIMNQVLDHFTISEARQIVVSFHEGTEVDLYETVTGKLQSFLTFMV